MKKILSIIILFISTITVSANDRDIELDKLFLELKKNIPSLSSGIAQQIWMLWSTHPTDQKLTSLLDEGSRLVQDQKLNRAIDVFTEAIELDPNWAEAWNKRATVLYLMGKYELSQSDINKVLQIEKRHFGALTGQGLVQIALKNYEKAIELYDQSLNKGLNDISAVYFNKGLVYERLSNVDLAKRKSFEIDCLLALEPICQHKWQEHIEIATHNAITVPKRSNGAETGQQIRKTLGIQVEEAETT